MATLIISQNDDVHAYAIQWALRLQKQICDLFFVHEMPLHRLSSMRLNTAESNVHISGLAESYNTVWLRRLGTPSDYPQGLSAEDKRMVKSQMVRYIDGLLCIMYPDATWVNAPDKRAVVNRKAAQLKAAAELGWLIPDTLMSNDPTEIRKFFSEYNGNVIFKAFHPAFWRDEDRELVSGLFTTKLSSHDIYGDDDAILASANIYQPLIQKRADVRVVFFGDTFRAVRIHSQETKSGTVDFRADMIGEAKHEEFLLPEAALRFCKRFRDKFGILHGSFDFIEALDGNLVFLEINEMGQFLWLEEKIPQLPLLDIATKFLQSPSPRFVYMGDQQSRCSYRDFVLSPGYKEIREMCSQRPSGNADAPFTYLEKSVDNG